MTEKEAPISSTSVSDKLLFILQTYSNAFSSKKISPDPTKTKLITPSLCFQSPPTHILSTYYVPGTLLSSKMHYCIYSSPSENKS